MVANKREVEIKILPDGSVHVETKGVKGKGCEDLIKFLQDSLGETKEKKRKPEYYERDNYLSENVSAKEK